MPLDLRTQIKYINNYHCDAIRRHVWVAPWASGKSFAIGHAVCHQVIKDRINGVDQGEYLYTGQSYTLANRNIRRGLRDAAAELNLKVQKYSGEDGKGFYFPECNAVLYVAGFGRMGDFDRNTGGSNLIAYWGDEVTHYAKEAVDLIPGRMREAENAKMSFFMNAESQYHWFYQEHVMDMHPNARYYETPWRENHHVPESYYEDIEAMDKNSLEYRRKVLNIWCDGDGIVYKIPPESIYKDGQLPPLNPRSRRYVGFDLGLHSRTAAVLLVQRQDGGYHVIKEYVHDVDKQGTLDENGHLSAVIKKFGRIDNIVMGHDSKHMDIVAQRMGIRSKRCLMTVDDRIAITQDAIYRGQISFSDPEDIETLKSCAMYGYAEVRSGEQLVRTNRPKHAYSDLPDALSYIGSELCQQAYSSFISSYQ